MSVVFIVWCVLLLCELLVRFGVRVCAELCLVVLNVLFVSLFCLS